MSSGVSSDSICASMCEEDDSNLLVAKQDTALLARHVERGVSNKTLRWSLVGKSEEFVYAYRAGLDDGNEG
jgi:hypothetical protein